jgi:membrane protein DedA with SNARE-associated domain
MDLLDVLKDYKYFAMFGILVLCGLGLPIPEEATLVISGLLVGWGGADFWLASAACVIGILVGDTVVFALGRFYGRRFLEIRLMRRVLTEKRQRKIGAIFARHGSKAVFGARFFAGIRIGVYAYAGQHGMSFFRFLLLDLLGALISGPTSIWLGKFAARTIADPADAEAFAKRILTTGQHWIYVVAALVALVFFLRWLLRRRQAAHQTGGVPVSSAPEVHEVLAPRAPVASSPAPALPVPREPLEEPPEPEAVLTAMGESRAPREHTSGREARRDGGPRSPTR